MVFLEGFDGCFSTEGVGRGDLLRSKYQSRKSDLMERRKDSGTLKKPLLLRRLTVEGAHECPLENDHRIHLRKAIGRGGRQVFNPLASCWDNIGHKLGFYGRLFGAI